MAATAHGTLGRRPVTAGLRSTVVRHAEALDLRGYSGFFAASRPRAV